MKTAKEILKSCLRLNNIIPFDDYTNTSVVKAMHEYASQFQLSGKWMRSQLSTSKPEVVEKEGWVDVKTRLPEIDKDDKWNNENRISKDVWTYSKKWGMVVGRYYYLAEYWTINGVTSSNGIEIDFWIPVPTPPTDNKL